MRRAIATQVDDDEWKTEVGMIEEHFDTFGDRLPQAMRTQLVALTERLG